jgi:DNA-binding beta-propeller fold protein YncE
MIRKISGRAYVGVVVLPLCLIGAAICVLLTGGAGRTRWNVFSPGNELRPTGNPQLVSVEPLAPAGGKSDGEMCQWVPASTSALTASLFEAAPLEGAAAASSADAGAPANADRAPSRVIRDTYPTYSAAVVDPIRNEIVAQDENLFQIMVFDRTANTSPKASFTEPKRVIAGPNTTLEFECGLYVDPKSGDIYSLANDVGDRLAVFTRDAKGDVPPNRVLNTPHGIYAIGVDEQRQEIYLTVQGGSVLVYRKSAQGDEKPLRVLQGPKTHLGSPYGVAVDTKRNLLFVASHGNFGEKRAGEGGARYETSLITIYPQDASGNTAPIRLIQGSKTQLNWPALMFVDEERGELYVANDGDDSVLVFPVTGDGDAAPSRVLKGPKTNLKNPSSAYVDAKNNELVVSNLGNHTITVYARDASGNTAPLRSIRSAPQGMLALTIVNPGGVAYDKKRDEILTPN